MADPYENEYRNYRSERKRKPKIVCSVSNCSNQSNRLEEYYWSKWKPYKNRGMPRFAPDNSICYNCQVRRNQLRQRPKCPQCCGVLPDPLPCSTSEDMEEPAGAGRKPSNACCVHFEDDPTYNDRHFPGRWTHNGSNDSLPNDRVEYCSLQFDMEDEACGSSNTSDGSKVRQDAISSSSSSARSSFPIEQLHPPAPLLAFKKCPCMESESVQYVEPPPSPTEEEEEEECHCSTEDDPDISPCQEHAMQLVKHLKRLSECIPDEPKNLVKEMAAHLAQEPLDEIKRQAERILKCAYEAEAEREHRTRFSSDVQVLPPEEENASTGGDSQQRKEEQEQLCRERQQQLYDEIEKQRQMLAQQASEIKRMRDLQKMHELQEQEANKNPPPPQITEVEHQQLTRTITDALHSMKKAPSPTPHRKPLPSNNLRLHSYPLSRSPRKKLK